MKLRWFIPFVFALSLFLLTLLLLTPAKAQTIPFIANPEVKLKHPPSTSALLPSSNLTPTLPLTSAPPLSAPWLPGNAQNFELVNYLGGGAAEQVSVQGRYAYVIFGTAELVILDLADPAHPRRVGSIARLLGSVRELYLIDHYAYILANGKPGWWVVDISDPTNPVEVGLYPGWGFTNITFVAGYAYLADDQGLRIVKLSTPAAPIEVAFFKTTEKAQQIAVVGQYAYIIEAAGPSANNAALRVVNVAVPTAPAEVKYQHLTGNVNNLTAADSYLYWVFSDFSISGMVQILSVSDPTTPTIVGMFEASPDKLMISNGNIYLVFCVLCQNERTALAVVDISKLTQPLQQDRIKLSYKVRDFAVVGDSVYLATEETGLRILDISQPASVTEIGAYQPSLTTITLADGYAYLGTRQSMQIMDISSPTTPSLVGSYQTTSPVRSLAVAHDKVVVVDEDSKVHLVDVSNPAHPVEAGVYIPPEPVSKVTLAGDYAYLFHQEGTGVYIVNVSNPNQPVEVGFYETQFVTSIAVAGDYAYIVTQRGWQIASISDPVAPIKVYDSGSGMFNEVVVRGAYVYLIGRDYNYDVLDVVDISNPAAPVSLKHYQSYFNFYSNLTIVGNYIYLINGDKVLAMDISDPASATPVGFYYPNWTAYPDLTSATLAVTSNTIYLASPGRGLFILRFQAPPLPQPTLSLELADHFGGATEAIAVQDQYAYVGFGSELAVLDISNPAHPSRVGSLIMSTNYNAIVENIYSAFPYVYVLDKYELHVVDVSEPTIPVEVGHVSINKDQGNQTDLRNTAITVVNDYAYLTQKRWNTCSGSCHGAWGFLIILDISNPHAPIEVSSFKTDDFATDLFVIDHYAYIAANTGLLLDVSNPITPTKVADSGSSTSFYKLVKADDYVYATNTTNNSMTGEVAVITTTDLTQPTVAAIIHKPTESYITEEIAQVGHYLYVAETLGRSPYQPRPEGDGLRILDISTPTTSTIAGFYPTPQGVTDLLVADNYVYLTTEEGGVQILDVSDPTQPVEVGGYEGFEKACDIAATEDTLYLTDENELQVLAPLAPTPVTTIKVLEEDSYWCGLRIVTMQDDAYLVNTSSVSPTLYSLNISNPLQPTLARPVESPYPLPGSEVMTSMGLYSAAATPDTITRVFTPSHYLYVSPDRYSGMEAILTSLDVSDPAHPTEVAQLPGFQGRELVIQGNFAYLPTAIGGLGILNISDPTAPQPVGWVNLGLFGTSWSVQDLAVEGNYAYLAGGGKLRVVDISNPVKPTEIGYHDVPDYDQRIAVTNGYIYVAVGESGLFVFRTP